MAPRTVENSGANARMIPAKRVGRGSMAASLGGDTTSLTITPASAPHTLDHTSKLAKVELRSLKCYDFCNEDHYNGRFRSPTNSYLIMFSLTRVTQHRPDKIFRSSMIYFGRHLTCGEE